MPGLTKVAVAYYSSTGISRPIAWFRRIPARCGPPGGDPVDLGVYLATTARVAATHERTRTTLRATWRAVRLSRRL